MNLPEHYLMTVALHAVVLSVVVFLAVLCLRKPQRVAVTALCGILAIAILPWFSAMRPRQVEAPVKTEARSELAVTRLPEWTVVRIPMAEAPVASTPMPSVSSPSSKRLDPEGLFAGAWALGAAILFLSLIVAAGKVARLRRTLEEPDDGAWQSIRDAVPDVPGRDCLRISRSGGSPCVAGFFMPLVVIPSFLLDPGKQRELRWALRHELRHWRGSDSRWTVVLEVARITQWWNPFIHLLISRWKMAREHVCDLAATDEDRATYGEFLIAMAAQPASRNPLSVMMVRRQRLRSLRARIVAVLNAAPGSTTPFEKSVLFSACFAMIGAALMISGFRIGNDGMAPTGASKETEAAFNILGEAYAEEEGEPEILQETDVITPGAEEDTPKVVNAEMVTQLKILTKIISAEEATVRNGSIFTEEEMQGQMRKFAQKKGTELTTTPSIVVRSNEAAMIEILREHPDDPPWKTDFMQPQLRGNRFAGWSLRVSAPYDGEKIALATDVGFGFVPGVRYPPNPIATGEDAKPEIVWDKLVRKDGVATGRLGPGETLAIDMGETNPGWFTTVFMTVVPIDVMGRPVESFEKALVPLPKPVKGKLKLRATVMERETFPDFDMDYEINMPMYAFSITKDHWAEVKKNLGAKDGTAFELAKGEVVPVGEAEEAKFSGELFEVGGFIQPRLNCWLKRDEEPFLPTRPPTISFETSPERVEIFRLKPKKQGMTRLLFLEVVAIVK